MEKQNTDKNTVVYEQFKKSKTGKLSLVGMIISALAFVISMLMRNNILVLANSECILSALNFICLGAFGYACVQMENFSVANSKTAK